MLNNQRVHMTTLFFINQPVGPSKISIRPAGSSKELHCPRPTFERSLTGSFSPPRRHQTALARDSLSNKWGKTYHYISFIWKSIVKSVNKAGKCTQAGNWPRKMNVLASLMAQLPGVRMGLVFTTPQLSGNYIWIIFKYWSIWRT